MSTYEAEQVIGELNAMKEIVLKVPKKAFDYVEANASDMTDYRRNGMCYCDIADLAIGLSSI